MIVISITRLSARRTLEKCSYARFVHEPAPIGLTTFNLEVRNRKCENFETGPKERLLIGLSFQHKYFSPLQMMISVYTRLLILTMTKKKIDSRKTVKKN